MANGIHMKAVYTRTRLAGSEDVAVTSHDFYYGGSGDGSDALLDSIAAPFITFWGVLTAGTTTAVIATQCRLTELRFYRGYNGDGSPGSVDYVKTYSLAGTGSVGMCPPQVACSVTELTDSRRHWGRFYLPGIGVGALALDGTLVTARINAIAGAAETMYESWGGLTDIDPVVWTRSSSPISYNAAVTPRWAPTWAFPSGTVYSAPAALNVQAIRVDEILDIQRRRRYESTQTRDTRQLA